MPGGSDVDSLVGMLRPSLLRRPDDGAEEVVDINSACVRLLSKRSTQSSAGDHAETSWRMNDKGERAARRVFAPAALWRA